MSLSKLFNFKYLLQNLKKSKMAIILFFIIVPIFTSLMIIAAEDATFDFISLASINMVGMYIIPFIFSVCLFGYVFKKNSVDFMGSMPISRKCIFITNTVGGIGLIVLMQILTFLLTLILGAITDCVIFSAMAFDVLVFQTIAYIFIFTIANLAMSVSGNLLTQIVVTVLITFLFPFSSWYISNANNNNYYNVIDYGTTVCNVTKIHNYTAPFLIADNGDYEFNEVSIYKMLGLIVVYFTLGYIAFTKRKMEIAGESFDNKYIHFITKGLTLAPFIAILIELDNEEFSVIAIILAIIAVYYFVYDLITSKKMKFRENVVGLVFSILALYGTYSIVLGIDDNLDKEFNIDDIKSIEIERSNEFKVTINDKEKIKSIIAMADKNEEYYYTPQNRVRVTTTISRYGGARYYKKFYVYVDELSELLADSFDTLKLSNNAVVDSEYFKLTKEEEAVLKNSLNEALNNISYKELVDMRYNSDIYIYEYKNHELVTWYYPINMSNEVAKLITKAYNRYAHEFLKTGYFVNYYDINFRGNVSDEVSSKMNLALNYLKDDELSKFILDNYNSEIKDFNKCVMIYANRFRFYTDDVDGILKILNKSYEENKKYIDEEYDNYYKPQYDDVKYNINAEVATPERVEVIID